MKGKSLNQIITLIKKNWQLLKEVQIVQKHMKNFPATQQET